MRLSRLTYLILALSALTACMPFGALGTPVMDGERDVEYTLVSNSAVDNLLIDAGATPPINDAGAPRSKSLDVKGLWAANSNTGLYLYIELPYMDPGSIEGEWAVAFHLGGANDTIARTGSVSDPYGASVDYKHSPACNVVLKSNMRGYLADYDGNQGWAFLVPVTKGLTDWDWANSNFLASGGWTTNTTAGTCTGLGSTGAGVVYKANRGIEVCIPLALFAGNPANTNVTAPVMGDVIRMQFYDNLRERTGTQYPRGPIDCVPFDPASRTPATRGAIGSWAPYTLTEVAALRVVSAQPASLTDAEHMKVGFSSALGAGASVPGNYAVRNMSTGEALSVTSAAIDPTEPTRAVLGVSVPFNCRLRVTVTGVKGANGAAVSPVENYADLPGLTRVRFHLRDPYGAVAALGTDPATGQPYAITLTGDMTGWSGTSDGSGEIPVSPVSGEPGHYRTPILLLPAGITSYKYRVPHLADWDNWNALNPHDRRFLVPAIETEVGANDNAAGTRNGIHYYGGALQAVFTLIDRDGIASGRPVYLTGELTDWSTGTGTAIAMLPVAGNPNMYRATVTLPEGYGRDVTTRYKYILKPDAGTTLWDELNPMGDRWAVFRAPAGQGAVVTDILGGSRLQRVLRIVSGLETAPMCSPYLTDLDADRNGGIDLKDIGALLRQDRLGPLPRIHAQGTKMVTEDGVEVTLRGINLGGWLVEEMWMTPWVQDPPSGSSYPKVQDHVSLWSVITQRLGAAAAANVRNAYRNAWIQPSDFNRIKAAGFNLVRLPFIYDLLDEPDGMAWIENAVQNANAAGLYVIFDMHGAPGCQNPWDHSGQMGVNSFFGSTANILKASEVWAGIAARFANTPGVLGCDLLNEPVGAADASTLHKVHNQLYQAIRAVAPNMLIIVEDGYKGFGTMPSPSLYGWTNVVYSTHLYDFNAASPQAHLDSLNAQLPGIIQNRATWNVPVFIGEFNLEPNNSADAMKQYTTTLTNNGLFWTLWTWKTVAANGPMGFWGYYSHPDAVTPLNPFTDSEAALISKTAQVRTINLTVPDGLAEALRP